jgi:glycosyltransferase involved in cell wall biosynthesis
MSAVSCVSVVMSVYNGGQYLKTAMDSVLKQSYKEIDFIIIDDGSSDNSLQILENFARADPRIRLISRENRGLTQSLNEGIGLAQGSFIARMDSDDVSQPQRIQRQLEFLQTQPDYVIVGSEVLQIDCDGDPLSIRDHHREHEAIDRQCLLGDGAAMTHPAVMIRKSALDKIGGYDPSFVTAQDLDLYLRLCEVGRAYNLPDIFLHWRQHPLSINRTRFDTWSEMKSKAVGNAIRRRGIDAYIAGVYSNLAGPYSCSYGEQCFAMAVAGRNFGTAWKHFWQNLSARRPSLSDVRTFLGLTLRSVEHLIRRLG